MKRNGCESGTVVRNPRLVCVFPQSEQVMVIGSVSGDDIRMPRTTKAVPESRRAAF